MIIIEDNKLIIVVKNANPLETLSDFKTAIHSLMQNINTDRSETHDDILQNIVSIGELLNAMDFDYCQHAEIAIATKESLGLHKALCNMV